MRALIFTYLLPAALWAGKNLLVVYRAIIYDQVNLFKENLKKSILVILSGAAICAIGYLFRINNADAFLCQANCLWGSAILLVGAYSFVVALRAVLC